MRRSLVPQPLVLCVLIGPLTPADVRVITRLFELGPCHCDVGPGLSRLEIAGLSLGQRRIDRSGCRCRAYRGNDPGDVPGRIAEQVGAPDAHMLPTEMAKPLYPQPVSDRKSTRLNSSHANISYAVFCLK